MTLIKELPLDDINAIILFIHERMLKNDSGHKKISEIINLLQNFDLVIKNGKMERFGF